MNKYSLLASVSASTLALAGGASAADLPVKVRQAAPIANWTGSYIGFNAGVVSHRSTIKDLDNWADEGYVSSNDLKSIGATVGGTIGYNWQEDAFIVGIEADINWVSAKANDRVTMCQTCSGGPGRVGTGGGVALLKSEMNWFATFRGRTGLTVGHTGATMVYVTGGLALAGINNRWGAGYASGGAAALTSDSHFVSDNVKIGWVVGGGIEHRFVNAPNWSVKAEGLWMDFQNKTVVNPGPGNFTGKTLPFHTQFLNDAAVGRIGLNYKFN